jgi:hypothetical protein
VTPEPTLKLTDDVVQDSGGFSNVELGVYVSRGHPHLRTELLDSGLASEIAAPWWRCRSRAVALKRGVVSGGIGSLVHNTRGMAIPLGLCMVVSVVAGVLGHVGLAGIAIAGLILASSVLVHELGHVVALRMLAPGSPAIMVSRGVHCHLVRKALCGWREITIVLSGPFAPALLSPLLLPWATVSPFLFWGWAAASVGHAVMPLFPVGDGSNLRSALTGHRSANRG